MSRQPWKESNPHLSVRSRLFSPLNYKATICGVPGGNRTLVLGFADQVPTHRTGTSGRFDSQTTLLRSSKPPGDPLQGASAEVLIPDGESHVIPLLGRRTQSSGSPRARPEIRVRRQAPEQVTGIEPVSGRWQRPA